MLTARERIERQMASPSLIRLHRALSRLTSTVTMMNTGAHPDDEQSGMLAYLRLGLGMRVIIACSTRGEGGQNVLGPERLGPLGVVRSRELEEAARAIDCDVSWLGHGPDDPVHDFGFSKDGDQTFVRWGEDRTVERLVLAYRKERPDIVVPTFLDVPGQHGHHRAMTRAAERAIRLAADPQAFPEHFAMGLTPWQVSKYYLPAWSGAGDAYDDELPPPDMTVMIDAEGVDPATGAQYDRIGEWSRYYHASQGMGRWPAEVDTQWPLHLKLGPQGSISEDHVLDGLPHSLSALGHDLPETLKAALGAADKDIVTARAAFPDSFRIIAALVEAARHVELVLTQAPAKFLALHGHRLERKIREIDAALVVAAGVEPRAWCEPATLAPGGQALLTLAFGNPADGIDAKPVLPHAVAVAEKNTFPNRMEFTLACPVEAPLTGLFVPGWSSLGGNGHGHVEIGVEIGGRHVVTTVDLEEPFAILPAQSVTLKPDTLILPIHGAPPPLRFSAGLAHPGEIGLRLPLGWKSTKEADGWTLTPPADIAAGDVAIVPLVDGQPAQRVTPIEYRHISRTAFRSDEVLHVLSLDLKLPEGARIGYVGGGADRVGVWMQRMGLDVTELDAAALARDLSGFTAIVIGIFAFGTRPDLAAATAAMHRYVEAGGHLVTLYHRPSDGWKPEETPPRLLQIGLPSLRWRVTDPTAEVTVLVPDHPLLTGPNVIGEEDWAGWNKERGLYFASRWDDAYEPLLAMHDPGEQPLKGSLLSARIGKGRHTHTSLVLHHQLDKRVPGAFRLLANLVQPA